MNKCFIIQFAAGLWLTVFCSCGIPSEQSKTEIVPAFYHWKTNLKLTDDTHANLQKIGVEKLYVKFFDIDWSLQFEQPTPTASLGLKTDFLENYQIIPTVFITNRTFLELPKDSVAGLALKTANKLKTDFKKFKLTDVREIQFDCDWSPQTREKFFFFLQKIKTHFAQKIDLSATIRLHQIKFFEKTGIPPVERGMLMFYNMSKVTDWATENSILDLAEAEKYLVNFEKYPLPLDVVLPAYSWGVLFRDGQMVKLFPGTYSADYQSFMKLDSTHFQLEKSDWFNGHYMYENDRIRLEDVSPEDLLKAAEMLAPLLKNSTLTVGFYHLHEHSFKRYSDEDYLDILEKFDAAAVKR